jgi:NAD(P)-dependent dehydrogenase (short-subunit alcohol dehydrogenase family)
MTEEEQMARNGQGSCAGKIAFVTGAGSGIGRATALAFARSGASGGAAGRAGLGSPIASGRRQRG